MTDFNKVVSELAKLDCKNMFGEDFFLTWEKSDDELKAKTQEFRDRLVKRFAKRPTWYLSWPM